MNLVFFQCFLLKLDVKEALNSVEKSYDYSKVELLFKCRELIKDSKQIIKKTTKYEDFIKKLKIK